MRDDHYTLIVRKRKGTTFLHLPTGHPLWQLQKDHMLLRLGGRLLRAKLVQLPEGNEQPVLELGRNFPWSPGLQLKLRMRLKGDIGYVGPIVGILCLTFKRVRYGPQDTLFRRMISEGNQLSIGCAVFSPGNLNFNTGVMRGYRWNGKRWIGYLLPLPDVVYHRTLYTPAVRSIERRLRARKRPVFNRRMGNKWHQYRILRQYGTLRSYLPLTRILKNPRDISVMINQSSGAYVKPIGGAKGRGIWRVERVGRGYSARYTDGRARVHRIKSNNLRAIYRSIRRRGAAYIVQPRLRLITWQGGIADIRALMQKDISGQWQVTGIGVRVGRRNSIVSNLSGGGSSMPLKPVLKEAFPNEPDKVEKILASLPVLAKQIAQILEKYSSPLGELGIDFGVDNSGHIWFIEANSRTGRSLFHRLNNEELGRAADRRPLEYSTYLAGFGLNT